jgi:hypothetical protein
MQLDISFAVLPQAPPSAGGRRGRRGGRQGQGQGRAGSSQDVRLLGEGGEGGGAHAGHDAPPFRPEYALEHSGGMAIHDDDWGLMDPQHAQHAPSSGPEGADMAVGPGPGGVRPGRARTGQQPPGRSSADDFPSLAAAAAAAAAAVGGEAAEHAQRGSGGGAAAAMQQAQRRPPPLVKHTVKCPCGRRVSHFVIEEGQQEVPGLECDAVCQLEGRKVQLAEAFGIEDPAHHVAHFGRR